MSVLPNFTLEAEKLFKNYGLTLFFEVSRIFKNKEITTKFMGSESQKKTWETLQTAKFQDIGLYPDCIGVVSNLSKTLFVNAWDPHSVPGNGNEGDNSLDGHIGRCTALQLFGCGESNPSLLESIIICPIQTS